MCARSAGGAAGGGRDCEVTGGGMEEFRIELRDVGIHRPSGLSWGSCTPRIWKLSPVVMGRGDVEEAREEAAAEERSSSEG